MKISSVFSTLLILIAAIAILLAQGVAADCPPGEYTVGNQCEACPPGYYCEGSNADRVACPAGTANSNHNSPGVASCVPCTDGYYNTEEGASTCQECPPGHYCPNKDAAPSPCQKGTYTSSSGAHTSCSSCGPGQYTPGTGSTSCSTCEAGYYCDGVDRTACSAGTYNPDIGSDSASDCTACSSGYYASQPGSPSCTKCPLGSVCPDPTEEPDSSLCTNGRYTPIDGATACSDCPPGHHCPTPMAAVACPKGSYAAGSGVRTQCTPCDADEYTDDTGSTSCTTCQPGFYCNGVDRTPCQAGTYSNVTGATSCTNCPSGYSCPNANGEPQACPKGSFTNSPSTSCTPCSSGQYTPGDKSTSCTTCEAGYFCLDGIDRTACPPGTYNPSPGGTSSSSCQVCPAGSYCPNGISVNACPAGTYNPSPGKQGVESCLTCAEGYYSTTTGATECTICPRGSICTSPSQPPDNVACTNGRYTSGSGSVECEDCPAGHYCPSPSADPVPCQLGTFSSQAGATLACQACAAGTFTPSTGSLECTACTPGTNCPDGSTKNSCSPGFYSEGTDTSCKPCPDGHYCPSTSTLPIPCEAGKFATSESTSCTTCTLGTYQPSEGQSSCLPCTSGHQCQNPTLHPIPCPAGTYAQEDGLGCLACPSGSYSAPGALSCTQCQPGYRCPNANGLPIACPVGSISEEGAVSCSACPSGSYSNEDRTVCLSCEVGYQCNDPSVGPVKCSPGTFANSQGSTECQVCPAGKFCSDPTLPPQDCVVGWSPLGSSECLPCPYNKQCTNPSITPQDCPSGQFSPEGVDTCSSCPPGTQCFPSTQTCPVGYYSLEGEVSCTECPAGYRCSNANGPEACSTGTYSLAGDSLCNLCPAGHYCPSPDQYPIPCEDGYFSVGGTVASCTACSPGFYCPDKTVSAQVPCQQGYYSIAGQKTCTRCPAGVACTTSVGYSPVICSPGTYSLGGSAQCEECPAGSKCPTPTELPVACPPGYYSEAGSADCTICPPGSYCPDPSQLPSLCGVGTYSYSGSISCKTCQGGVVCSQGATSPLDGTICPTGSYCPPGTPQPVACPAGTYGTSAGQAEMQTACASCLAGKICDQGSVDLTNANCPRGHYCPSGTRFADEFPCPAGTYNSDFGKTSITDCQICPQGNFCEEGTITTSASTLCAAGHYCPPGTTHAREFPCPAGTYSGSTGLFEEAQCSACPPGYFCRLGATTPTPCPRGTYSPTPSAISAETCVACPAGWACSDLAMTDPHIYKCSPGHYCPQGTAGPQDHPCPAGTYTDRDDLTNVGDCELCLQGTICEEGTGAGVKSPITCTQGYYCPGVASLSPPTYFKDINALAGGDYYSIPGLATGQSQLPCPPGTYGTTSGGIDISVCEQCPGGRYCVKASSTISGFCEPGYFCPPGSSSPTANPCPEGTFSANNSLSDSSECEICPEGHYCPIHSTSPTPCPSGSYAPGMGTKGMGPSTLTSGKCVTCPGGYSCQGTGVITPTECGVGYYSMDGEDTCHVCPAGYFCPLGNTSRSSMLTDYVCPEGYYCPEGTSIDFTDNSVNTDAFLCADKHFCPAGTPLPLKCPPGTYNFNQGLKSIQECVVCTEGYYCLEGSYNASAKCEPGFYCPPGSTGPREVPCPAGTYSNYYGTTSAENCTICPAGSYCPPGTSEPIECPNGYYCHCGLGYPEPCPLGTYGSKPGLPSVESCTLCPAGQYCDGVGEIYPTGPCDPGYYCLEGAYTSQPPGAPTGGLCPRGGYCIQGSPVPEACPLGTFNNFTGGKSEDDCVPCTPGFYCSGTNNPSPTGPCNAGYYCDGGAPIPTQHATPAGYYTLEGSSSPIPCPQGTYNPYSTQSECSLCDEGFYCPNMAMESRFTCPPGSYCPEGSVIPTPCPSGTYSNQSNLRNVSECLECPSGMYCERSGLIEPSGLCAEGHYCLGGTIRANPVSSPGDDQFGDLCKAGRFCPNGTRNADEHLCPPGTYSPTTGNKDESDCQSCSPGYYCPTSGLTTPTLLCGAGFYCIEGARFENPVDGVTGDVCPSGHYCEVGSSYPVACPPKTYQSRSGQSTCEECPAGSYCDDPSGTINPAICPPGHYCPQNSSVPTPCPIGTFSNSSGLSNVSECSFCSGGYFCSTPGLLEPTEKCDAGYFCTQGAISEVGATNPVVGGSGGLCLPGHYCLEGTSLPTKCPPGTYSPSSGNTNVTLCLDCPPGKYCEESALTSPTGNCSAGYYCTGGSFSPTPTNATSMCFGSTGGECPPGTYCEEGSFAPKSCSVGYYQDQYAQSSCKICPEGFFCNATGGTESPTPCLPGYYCPEGSGSFLLGCPAGSFSNIPGLKKDTDCTLCTGGKYCSVSGLTAPDGDCLEGYYCTSGAMSQTGDAGSLGGIGGICTKGTYCPSGSSSPQQCPAGTYSPSIGNKNISDCISCPGGSYCSLNGLEEPNGVCDAGCYCLGGSNSPCPVDGPLGGTCPKGHYCEIGSVTPHPCEAGNYSSVAGKSKCDICPPGAYCPPGSIDPLDCPPGRYCPGGVGIVIPQCPSGTSSNLTNLVSESQCTLCSGGKFCGSSGLTAPEGNCAPGYYCVRGAVNNMGLLGVGGGDSGFCPKGYYCEEQSTIPSPCPLGSFSNIDGLGSRDDCTPCTPGMYCDTPGLTEPRGNCSAGYYCPLSQTTPSPAAYICPEGHYCEEGFSAPLGCSPGTYRSTPGGSSCDICPEGSFCSNNTITPEICPPTFYCPEGTGTPIYCPAGRYSNTSGLSDPSQCIPCPAGKWCSQGIVIGDCSAGYHCKLGSDTPTPNYLPGENTMGSLCPKGFYCLIGTVTPSQCPSGLFSDVLGAQDSSVCGPCLAGYMCFEGSSERYPCPIGRYCPMSEPVQNCPVSTYNPLEYASNSTSCIPCEEGYYCPDEGMGTYTTYPCPIAHYCPMGAVEPTPCPSGTYRPEQFGSSPASCHQCPAGHYCPAASSAPIECISTNTSAVFCTAGSAFPQTCPSTKYCQQRTSIPFDCPAGYYCPFNTYEPIICPEAHYCPSGVALPIQCPFGYKIRSDIGPGSLRATLEDSCELCPGGTYGNHPTRQTCSPCDEGYYCEAGATHPEVIPGISKSVYICPLGYYCEAGSDKPTACPVGHYQDETGKTNCKKCAAGQHNPTVGSSKCSICGPNSYSEEGAETCTCYGSNRVYQDSDRMCLCKPGYIFYNEDFSIGNDTDASTDCQPFIYDRCNTGSARARDVVGNCIPDGPEACKEFCGYSNGKGSINSELGLCECFSLVNEDEVCDTSCRSKELVLSINRLNKNLELYDPNTQSIISSYSFQSLTAGSVNCPLETCQIFPVQTTDIGFRGVYRASTNYYTNLLNHTMLSTIPITDTRAIFEDAPQYIEQIGILQPAVCLEYGSSLMWDISHPSRLHYPVYMKDALLNTVPDFDYGPFRQLDALMRSNITMTTFIYTFTKAGVFVFHDYSSTSKIMIVRVMSTTESCPSTATFKPITSSNLVTLGIKRRDEMLLAPDWILVVVLLLGFLLFISILIVGIHYFRTRTWKGAKAGTGAFRKPIPLTDIESKGFGFAQRQLYLSKQKTISKGIDDESNVLDLEGFSVTTFYDKLREHKDNVKHDVRDYQDEFMQKYNKLLAETKEIKDMLSNLDSKGASSLDVALGIQNMPKANSAENAESIVLILKDQLEKLKQEKAKKIPFDPNNSDLDPADIKRMYNLDLEEDKNRDSTINQYELLVSRLEDKLSDAHGDDISAMLDQFNKTFETSRLIIGKSLDKVNAAIAEKNNISRKTEDPFTKFNLSDDMAHALKDFLANQMKTLFDKYTSLGNAAASIDNEILDTLAEKTNEEENAIDEKILEESDTESDDDNDDLADADDALRTLSKEHKAKRIEMHHQHRAEVQKIMDESQEKESKGSEFISNLLDDHTQKSLDQIKERTNNIVKNKELTTDERAAALEKGKKHMDELKHKLSEEKQLQLEKMQNELKAATLQKLTLLKDAHKQQKELQNSLEAEASEEIEKILKSFEANKGKYDDKAQAEMIKQKELLKQKLEQQRRSREKRHALEKEQLTNLLEKENEIDRKFESDKLDNIFDAIVAQKNEEIENAVKNFVGPKSERDNLQKQLKKELDGLKKSLAETKKGQMEAFEEELQTRNAAREQELEKKHALEEQADIKKQEAALEELKKIMGLGADTSTRVADSIIDQRKKQSEQLAERMNALAKKRAEKLKEFQKEEENAEKQLAAEEVEEKKEIEKVMEEDYKKKTEELKAQLENDLKNCKSEEEKQKLLALHGEEMSQLTNSLERAKQSQLSDMERRLAERRQQMMKNLQNKKNKSLISELELQDQSLKEAANMQTVTDKDIVAQVPAVQVKRVNSSLMKELEKKLLDRVSNVEKQLIEEEKKELDSIEKEAASLEKNLEEEKEKKKKLTEEKFQLKASNASEEEKAKIMDDLASSLSNIDKQYKDESKRQNDLLQKKLEARRKMLAERKAKKIEEVKQVQEEENMNILTEENFKVEHEAIDEVLSKDTIQLPVLDALIDKTLLPRQAKELETLENDMKTQIDNAATPEDKEGLKLKHLESRVKLRERHINEKRRLADLFQNHPSIVAPLADLDAQADEELKKYSEEIERQKQENLKKIEAQKQEVKAKMQEELDRIKREMEEEKARLKRTIEDEKNKLTVKELMKEQEIELQKQIEQQKNLAEDERHQILAKHKSNMDAFENALEAERVRQDEILKNRIDEIMNLKLKQKEDEANHKVDAEFSADIQATKQRQEENVAKNALKVARSTMSLMSLISGRGKVQKTSFEEGDVTVRQTIDVKQIEPKLSDEQAWLGPIYQKLKDIESLLLVEKRPYIDIRDQHIRNEGKLEEVKETSLSLRDIIYFRFAQFIIRLLRSKFTFLPEINLLVAKSLPVTHYNHNAFRNSFYYDRVRNALFIRDTRLSNIGKLIIIMVHCVAHIGIKDMSNDENPLFTKYFYTMLEVVCEDLFLNRQSLELTDENREQILSAITQMTAHPRSTTPTGLGVEVTTNVEVVVKPTIARINSSKSMMNEIVSQVGPSQMHEKNLQIRKLSLELNALQESLKTVTDPDQQQSINNKIELVKKQLAQFKS